LKNYKVWLIHRIKGLTFFEAIVALAILVIIAASIAPMLSHFSRRQELEISAVSLAQDLRQTQQFSRAQRDGYSYHGLRFYNGLGEDGDRQGYKLLRFCQTDASGSCVGEPVSVPFDASSACSVPNSTSCEVIKGSEQLDNPELLENTFFTKRVTIEPTGSDFQPGDTIVFTSEGSATTDGQTFLTDVNGDGTIGIVLTLNGSSKTIVITPLTGYVRIQ
jgi:type II secretory pathway pseudopilin PulG